MANNEHNPQLTSDGYSENAEADAFMLPSPEEMLRRVFRHWFAAAVGLLVTLAATILYTQLQTPEYDSHAKVLLRLGRELVYQGEVGDRTPVIRHNRQAYMNSELEILRASDTVAGALDRIGISRLYPDLDPGDDPHERFLASISAAAVPNSDVMALRFRHLDPKLATLALDALLEEFRLRHVAAFSGAASTPFLTEKVEGFRTRLTNAEDKLVAFENEHSAFALDDPRAHLAVRKRDIQLGLLDVERRIAAARQATLEDPHQLQEARGRMLELRLELDDLLQRFTPTSTAVVDARQKLAAVKSFIDSQEPVIAGDRSRAIRPLLTQRADLSSELRAVEKTILALPELARLHRDLSRERDASAMLFDTYSRRLEDALLSAEMDQENIASIRVIQPPSHPTEPSSPRRVLNLAVGLILGLAMALLTANLVAWWTGRVEPPSGSDPETDPLDEGPTEDELRQFDVPPPERWRRVDESDLAADTPGHYSMVRTGVGEWQRVWPTA